jgi:hypothetical protein
MIKNTVLVLSSLLLFSSCSQKQPLTEENNVKDNKHDMGYYQCVKKDAKNYSVSYMSINYNTNNRTEPKEEKLKRIINEKGFQECKELTEEITESYLCEKNGKKEKVDVNYLKDWNVDPRRILSLKFYEVDKCEKINTVN